MEQIEKVPMSTDFSSSDLFEYSKIWNKYRDQEDLIIQVLKGKSKVLRETLEDLLRNDDDFRDREMRTVRSFTFYDGGRDLDFFKSFNTLLRSMDLIDGITVDEGTFTLNLRDFDLDHFTIDGRLISDDFVGEELFLQLVEAAYFITKYSYRLRDSSIKKKVYLKGSPYTRDELINILKNEFPEQSDESASMNEGEDGSNLKRWLNRWDSLTFLIEPAPLPLPE